MAKSELYNNPLIPVVLVAGILSGGLWRGTAVDSPEKPGSLSSSGDKSDGAPPPVSWISNLRPALESLDAALGAHSESARTSSLTNATTVALAARGEARDRQILEAMVGLRINLDRLSSPAAPASGSSGLRCAPASPRRRR